MRAINVIAFIELLKCISQAENNLSFTQRLIYSAVISIIFFVGLIAMLRFAVNRHYENKLMRTYTRLDRIEKEKEKIEKKLEKLDETIKEKDAEISRLNEEIKKKDNMIANYQEKMKKLENIIKYARELREEKERLEREIEELEIRLEEKEEEIEKIKEMVPYKDEEHYGDLSYWTGKRLYELKQKFPKMTYRKLEEITGISKSTIQKRISKYMEQIDKL